MNRMKSITLKIATLTLVITALFYPKPALASTDYPGFVTVLYQQMLGRSPGSSELSYWVGQLNNGAARSTVTNGIYFTDEGRTYRLKNLYLYVLNRPIDSGAQSYWLSYIDSGHTEGEVVANVYASSEFFNDCGDNYNTWVNAVYEKMLHRPADSSGLAYWSSLASNPSYGLYYVAEQIYLTTEAVQVSIADIINRYFNRAPTSTEDSIASNYTSLGTRDHLESDIASMWVCTSAGGAGCPPPPPPPILVAVLGGTLESSDAVNFTYRPSDPRAGYTLDRSPNPLKITSQDTHDVLSIAYGNAGLSLILRVDGERVRDDRITWDSKQRITIHDTFSYSGSGTSQTVAERSESDGYDANNNLTSRSLRDGVIQVPIPYALPTAYVSSESATYDSKNRVQAYSLSETGPNINGTHNVSASSTYTDATDGSYVEVRTSNDSASSYPFSDEISRDSAGNVTQFSRSEYDNFGSPLYETWNYSWYPANSNLVTPENPNGQVVQTASYVDAMGRTTQESYNPSGYLMSNSDGLYAVTIQRDTYNRVTAYAVNNTTRYQATYNSTDPAAKPTSATEYGPSGTSLHYALNTDGTTTVTSVGYDGKTTVTTLSTTSDPIRLQIPDGTLLTYSTSASTLMNTSGTVYTFNVPPDPALETQSTLVLSNFTAPVSAVANTTVTVGCNFGVVIGCVVATHNGAGDAFSSWSGTTALFTYTADAAGTVEKNVCQLVQESSDSRCVNEQIPISETVTQ